MGIPKIIGVCDEYFLDGIMLYRLAIYRFYNVSRIKLTPEHLTQIKSALEKLLAGSRPCNSIATQYDVARFGTVGTKEKTFACKLESISKGNRINFEG